MLARLMNFVEHGPRCDFVQPMWHKGPCDCGLFTLFEEISSALAGPWEAHKMPDDVRDAIVGSEAYQRWLNRGEHER